MVKHNQEKESWVDILKIIAKKKTWMFLLFIVILVLSLRADFSCGRINGEWDFHIKVKNLDDKISIRR